jgi:ribonuclease HII
MSPSFTHEQLYWQQGLTRVAGLDEVGLGAWAGPVVAGAVIFSPLSLRRRGVGGEVNLIRDSKSLSAVQRQKAALFIKSEAIAWGVGEASVEEINQLNILAASHLAFARAVENLGRPPHVLLIDGRPANVLESIRTQNIVKGDQQSYSIAAASILAKVHRDQLLTTLDATHPAYGFAAHKGYGAPRHAASLQTHGPCPAHRAAYAPVRRAAALAKLS